MDHFQSPVSCSLLPPLYPAFCSQHSCQWEPAKPSHMMSLLCSNPTKPRSSQGPVWPTRSCPAAPTFTPPLTLSLHMRSLAAFALAVLAPGMLLSWISMTHFLTSFSSFFKYYLISGASSKHPVETASSIAKSYSALFFSRECTTFWLSVISSLPQLECNYHKGGVLMCFIQCCVPVPDTYWYLNSPLNKQNNST